MTTFSFLGEPSIANWNIQSQKAAEPKTTVQDGVSTFVCMKLLNIFNRTLGHCTAVCGYRTRKTKTWSFPNPNQVFLCLNLTSGRNHKFQNVHCLQKTPFILPIRLQHFIYLFLKTKVLKWYLGYALSSKVNISINSHITYCNHIILPMASLFQRNQVQFIQYMSASNPEPARGPLQ